MLPVKINLVCPIRRINLLAHVLILKNDKIMIISAAVHNSLGLLGGDIAP
jgi:hypothetical protein